MQDLDIFLHNWQEHSIEVKKLFLRLYGFAKTIPNVQIQYSERPGISHSLRVGLAGNSERPFFAVIDIIDDEPEARWISMCMYADLVIDPERKGDLIPKGLNHQDAVCFDIDEANENTSAYLLEILYNAARLSNSASIQPKLP